MKQQWASKYNAFNSLKTLKHVQYWSTIKDGRIPPPRFVSIDPNGRCDFKCPHCNASAVLKKIKQSMTRRTMQKIVKLLSQWKTKAVCIGGGGQSLLNKNTPYLIDLLNRRKIQVGIVTNGSHLNKRLETLLKCKWIGVSMDAASPQTYAKMKGVNKNVFNKVIKNISEATKLRQTQVSYKYLLHPNNWRQVYHAIKLAKQIGCNLIHIRPGAQPWFEVGKKSFDFTQDMIKHVLGQIQQGRMDFEDSDFKIYGITHKFTGRWNIKKSFKKCWAVYTTCFVSPNGDIGLCCDRRGDDSMVIGNVDNIRQMWGSQQHVRIRKSINVQSCPRCTYSHINQIFQNVVLQDKMMCNMY